MEEEGERQMHAHAECGCFTLMSSKKMCFRTNYVAFSTSLAILLKNNVQTKCHKRKSRQKYVISPTFLFCSLEAQVIVTFL